jgi:hypothetical protein
MIVGMSGLQISIAVMTDSQSIPEAATKLPKILLDKTEITSWLLVAEVTNNLMTPF